MPKCTVCYSLLASVNGLKLHLQLKHNNFSDVFKCQEPNCFRTLKSWNKFRRHLIDCHNCPISAQLMIKKQYVVKDNSDDISEPMDFDVILGNNDQSSDNTMHVHSLSDLEKYVHSLGLEVVCKLYANTNLPRKHVQETVEMVDDLIGNIFSAVFSYASNLNESDYKNGNASESLIPTNVLDSVLRPFRSSLSSEYLRLQAIEETGCFIKPRDVVIGDRLDDVLHEGRIIQDRTAVKSKFIPIREVLHQFLSLPGVLKSILSYTDFLKAEKAGGIMSNFIQGELWSEKAAKLQGKIVLPIFIYYDDFEVNNPLGSHAGIQKLGGVYFSLPCLPPESRSCLENLFLTLLFHSSDRKAFGNETIFKILVEEINYLQANGVNVSVDGKEYVIYFALGLFLGDNEGLNSALGFTEGFRSNYFCRLCKVHRQNSEQNKYITDTLLRSTEEYERDGFENSEKTGVKENSVWNLILFFHVVMNFAVDIMHDILEGVCRYDIAHILYYYIITKKYFTVEQLNAKILSFNYASNGFSNKPPVFTTKNISDRHLCMSASEMLTFVLLFPMLVCDLFVISDKDEVWQFYIVLREIMDIIFSKSIQAEAADVLDVLVSQHHKMYLKLFNDTLKPKHHNMKHYGLVMRMSGPLSHLSSMRFESKHRTLKTVAKATTSRVNITHTISVKEQLNLCYRFICKKGLTERFDFGSGDRLENVNELEDYYLLRDSLPISFTGSCIVVPWASIKGIHYRLGSVVSIDCSLDSFPIFGKVRTIFMNNCEEVCFVCDVFSTLKFCDKTHAYEVKSRNTLKCITYSQLLSPFLNILHRKGNGDLFVMLRHHL